MAVTNLIEAVLGRDNLKWNALMHLLHWLLDKDEGHQLGDKIAQDFCLYVFGKYSSCEIGREHCLSGTTDGTGYFADIALGIPSLGAPPFSEPNFFAIVEDIDFKASGDRKKIQRLKNYHSTIRARFPNTVVRRVVLTNADGAEGIWPLYAENAFGPEAENFTQLDGWKLLPLKKVGGWVTNAARAASPGLENKMQLFLQDFVKWSDSVSSRAPKVKSLAAGH